MNKKIKIIELLNKVAHEEEVPKTIRAYYGHVHDDYKYDEILKWYITLDDTTVLNAIDKLNFEVEILEDNTEEIEELDNWFVDERKECREFDIQAINLCFSKHRDKINELVKAVKEIRKDLNK